jgi:hypothetical protein
VYISCSKDLSKGRELKSSQLTWLGLLFLAKREKYDACLETNASEIEKHAELIARSAIINQLLL